MLREVAVNGTSVRAATKAYGFSRAWYYQIKKAFDEQGLAGLLDELPGRKGPDKLTNEIVEFILEQKKENPKLSSLLISDMVLRTFQVKLTDRTIRRVLQGDDTDLGKKNA